MHFLPNDPMNESNTIYKTRFYSDCIGVFQGGGCRAAALGGAYDEAFKLGVRFSEVAGTSAGSIVAALIAAGAEPQYLLGKLRELDFTTLIKSPKKSTFTKVRKRVWLAQWVPFKGEMGRAAVKFARMGGLNSSEKIGEWVEECLRDLIGKASGPVLFSDLLMPLHVVAGDLSTMKPRVWSNHASPNQSVAHAVRASCSIPGFFQPVEEGATLLVDGGVVSNIPHFLFNGAAKRGRQSKRVLLFMLESTEEQNRACDAKELASQVASLAVDGGMDVQLSFTPNIAKIVIPTGAIQATDFDSMDAGKVNSLIESGQRTAHKFITEELLNSQGAGSGVSIIYDEHEAFLAVAERLNSVRQSVRIAMRDTKWFWELFPTVLNWKKTGIQVTVFTTPLGGCSSEGPKEKQRRGFLDGMGVELKVVPSLAFEGFLFDDATAVDSAALIFRGEKSDYEPLARYYSGRIDQTAVSALGDKFSLNSAFDGMNFQPKMSSSDESTLLELLKTNVPFYRDPEVRLSIEEIEISRIHLISRFVRAFRYKQIGSLVESYSEAGLELFEPAQISLRDGTYSIVTPPVVEPAGLDFVALEGNTRFLYCLNNGISKVRAVVVRGVGVELPAAPIPLKRVTITAVKRPPEERMVAFDHTRFRDIERAVRPLPTI
ncbi:patatin-like phospholipase family protein [Luteolibacter soli]|uniref:Patatin-like phospholipase family protein n=1 Tax=Luteolibacter soli TaxID=3135280 RepID=A0ABU9AUR7_9BACT